MKLKSKSQTHRLNEHFTVPNGIRVFLEEEVREKQNFVLIVEA